MAKAPIFRRLKEHQTKQRHTKQKSKTLSTACLRRPRTPDGNKTKKPSEIALEGLRKKTAATYSPAGVQYHRRGQA